MPTDNDTTDMIPLAEWAADNGVPLRTAHNWATDKEIPVQVMTMQRKVVTLRNIKGFYINRNATKPERCK